MKKALLVLEDGTVYIGKSFGKEGTAFGEVVFNTCMTGYQRIITDPSYRGQIVVMTYPLIGNVGFNEEDSESDECQVSGFIVKELCDMPSNWRCRQDPKSYFEDHGVVGICDIDTRHLTRHIRKYGSMAGVITTDTDADPKDLAAKASGLSKEHRDYVDTVTIKAIRHMEGSGPRIAIVDLGVKKSLVSSLAQYGCELFIMPAYSSAEEILSQNPDGILFSGGPGSPAHIPYAIETAQKLIGKKALMGIGLGHQLLGLALGGQAYKLKFGHHGGNHPVKDLIHNKIKMTSQNHSYALEEDICSGAVITHVNLHDNTVEGFSHRDYPIIGLQYDPESLAGPSGFDEVLTEFINLAKKQS